jgi:hypothetical protein
MTRVQPGGHGKDLSDFKGVHGPTAGGAGRTMNTSL